ncbi:Proline-specific permease [Sphaceloma murrayae]|uniref:Proline-specific permease n=1 Tax=Sphaceloma murrayae TaxID=2082308 RepID=A0A2K1QHE6_9PEZI|nr:Proline-specific permease [Sphaceloma murrayae]
MSISHATGSPATGSGDYEKDAGGVTERRTSRKGSVFGAIKDNYAVNNADDEYSIVKGDSTHRMLKPRHIQLIGIGGTIGTALFVQIGRGLLNGGPGSLFLAFTIWYA